jgi:cell volume regulation protein A
LGRPARQGDIVNIGTIALLAHKVTEGRVTTVGLRLAEPDIDTCTWQGRATALLAAIRKRLFG